MDMISQELILIPWHLINVFINAESISYKIWHNQLLLQYCAKLCMCVFLSTLAKLMACTCMWSVNDAHTQDQALPDYSTSVVASYMSVCVGVCVYSAIIMSLWLSVHTKLWSLQLHCTAHTSLPLNPPHALPLGRRPRSGQEGYALVLLPLWSSDEVGNHPPLPDHPEAPLTLSPHLPRRGWSSLHKRWCSLTNLCRYLILTAVCLHFLFKKK